MKTRTLADLRAWVMLQPDGRVLIDSREFLSEQSVWETVLGWPDKSEVEEAKKLGYRVVRARVIVEEDVEP